MLNWQLLHYGKLSKRTIAEAVEDEEWQRVRRSMKGKSLERKYEILAAWITKQGCSDKAMIQVTNYVNALKRGGLI